MLSGLAPPSICAGTGSRPLADLPGVGRKPSGRTCRRGWSSSATTPPSNDEVRSPVDKLRIGLKYITSRSGPMTMAGVAGHRLPAHLARRGHPPISSSTSSPWSADSPSEGVHPFSAFTSPPAPLGLPAAPPKAAAISNSQAPTPARAPLNPPELPRDGRTIAAPSSKACASPAAIAREMPLSAEISAEFRPGPEVHDADDAALLDWVRNSATTIYHPTGTCGMGGRKGRDGRGRCPAAGSRGRGSQRRRLTRSCPRIVSGNTNAPAIMIGEKASDMVSKDIRDLAHAPA